MKKMICSICSYTYDEAVGIPELDIAPGTKWEELPPDWQCPVCKAGKSAFNKDYGNPQKSSLPNAQAEKPHVEKELSPMEMSIICSNLARGCEKQYLTDEAQDFTRLSEFFKAQADKEYNPDNLQRLIDLVDNDLSSGYPYANAVASEKGDRGALRCLTWSEKVTHMLQFLLKRYNNEGDKMLQNTGVYVCSICGFIFLGNEPPEICPVCKVPARKFDKIEGRA